MVVVVIWRIHQTKVTSRVPSGLQKHNLRMLYCFPLCRESVPLASDNWTTEGLQGYDKLTQQGCGSHFGSNFWSVPGSWVGLRLDYVHTANEHRVEVELNTAGVKAPPIFATKFSINRTAQRTYLRQNAQNNNKQHFTGTQYVLVSIKCSQIGAVIHHHPTCYISDWNILYNTALPSCPQCSSQEILNQPHNCHVIEQIANQNILIYP